MSILTAEVVTVKSYSEQLAELEAELEAAQAANDPTAWLMAWRAREDMLIGQFLAEYPPCRDDDPGPGPMTPAEAEVEDVPSELDHLYNTWYALGYDCVDAAPGAGLDTIRLWIARLAYERGWARGLSDRYTWLDSMEWDRIEAEEAEVRSALGHPSWDWDASDFASEGY